MKDQKFADAFDAAFRTMVESIEASKPEGAVTVHYAVVAVPIGEDQRGITTYVNDTTGRKMLATFAGLMMEAAIQSRSPGVVDMLKGVTLLLLAEGPEAKDALRKADEAFAQEQAAD